MLTVQCWHKFKNPTSVDIPAFDHDDSNFFSCESLYSFSRVQDFFGYFYSHVHTWVMEFLQHTGPDFVNLFELMQSFCLMEVTIQAIECLRSDPLAIWNITYLFISFVIYESVSHAAFSEDIFRVGGVFFQFLSQVIDVETHIMRFIAVFVTPYFLQ